MARGPWIDHFGDNFLWSNATLIIKGMAPYGVVALEEMDRACEKLRLRQHEPHAWQEEWGAIAELVEKRADAAAAEGRKASAGDYYLRAGNYFYNAERFILPGEEKRAWGQPRLPLLSRRDQAAVSEHRVRRGALPGHHSAGAVHEGRRRHRPGADRGDRQRHG